jgi:hypothetical protein
MRQVLKYMLTIVLMVAVVGAFAAPTGAKTISVTERATLKLKRDGTRLTGSGTATGTLPGTVTADLRAVGLGVKGTVRLVTRGGSLTINVNATLADRTSTVDKLSGTIAVRSGTGAFADAVGAGPVSATLNRRSNSRGEQVATVSARNLRLSY